MPSRSARFRLSSIAGIGKGLTAKDLSTLQSSQAITFTKTSIDTPMFLISELVSR